MTSYIDIKEFESSFNLNKYFKIFFKKVKDIWDVLKEYDLYNGTRWDNYD